MGAIQLIRHGQGSWFADDYDHLSDLGRRQAQWLGSAWEASGFEPTLSVTGTMRRLQQSAIATIDAVDGDLFDVDAGWDEYDHLSMTDTRDASARPTEAREYQKLLDSALTWWVDGGPADELFVDFSRRVLASFDAVVARATRGERIAVFTAGGPIALITSRLLSGDASLFIKLNRVVVNSSVTTVIVGRTGPQLLTFNEHGHIPPDQVTFR